MYVSTSQALIERASKILEMIHDCNNRIVNTNITLLAYDKASWYDNVRIFYSRSGLLERLDNLEAVKERLIKAYSKTCEKALAEALKQLLLYNPIKRTI